MQMFSKHKRCLNFRCRVFAFLRFLKTFSNLRSSSLLWALSEIKHLNSMISWSSFSLLVFQIFILKFLQKISVFNEKTFQFPDFISGYDLSELSIIIFPSFLCSSRNSRENSSPTLLATYFWELEKVPNLGLVFESRMARNSRSSRHDMTGRQTDNLSVLFWNPCAKKRGMKSEYVIQTKDKEIDWETDRERER